MNDFGNRIMYRTGLSQILPEFEENGVQQAIHMLEGQSNLEPILREMKNQEVGAVEVIIGGEGRYAEFSRLSMVLGRYGTKHIVGTIGVVGPTRMHYGHAISVVSYVAELISQFLTDIHGEESSEGR
jgi:heat-inducible transcriptional repressor